MALCPAYHRCSFRTLHTMLHTSTTNSLKLACKIKLICHPWSRSAPSFGTWALLTFSNQSPNMLFLLYALSSCHFKEDSVFFKETQLQGLETGFYVDVSLASTVWCLPAKPKLGFQSPNIAYVQMREHMLLMSGAGLGAETQICIYETVKPTLLRI